LPPRKNQDPPIANSAILLLQKVSATQDMRYFVAGYLSKLASLQVILSPMYTGRRYHLQLRVIGWLLIAAVFALTVQPVHFHLQHIDDASSLIHEHAIDLHIAIDNIAPDSHEDGAIFPVTPDVMLKKIGDNPLLAAIIIWLTVFLLSVAYSNKPRPTIRFILLKRRWFSIAPPLRAPPSF